MKQKLDKILGWILVVLMSVMVLAVLWQVFSRYVLQSPSSYTEELARYLLVWIGVLGAAYASGQREHLSVNLLERKLDDENKRRLQTIINLLIVLFSITVLIIGGGNLVLVNLELGQNSAALGVPLFLVYTVIPLSGLLVVIYKLKEIKLIKSFK